MNLHDWIDELCDVLDVETEVDESLLGDVARAAAHNVQKLAAPVTTYLLGYAAAEQGADARDIETLAAKAQLLAEGWDRPSTAKSSDGIDDEVPDDSAVDHSQDLADLP